MSNLFDLGPLDKAAAQDTQRAEAPAVQLNAQQRAAVLHGDGPMLVVAGAGTGKTRVITERIRHLLETQPELKGEEILGLTFTRKAAGEMLWRVAATAGERGKMRSRREHFTSSAKKLSASSIRDCACWTIPITGFCCAEICGC